MHTLGELDPRTRAAISCFWAIEDVDAKLERLARDLETGAWEERYGGLLGMESCDLGYRLVVGSV